MPVEKIAQVYLVNYSANLQLMSVTFVARSLTPLLDYVHAI